MKVFNLKVYMPHAGWQNQGVFNDRGVAREVGDATVLWVYGRVDTTLYDVETWVLNHCMDEILENYEEYMENLGESSRPESK